MGITLLVIGAIIVIIGVVKDIKPKEGEGSILGLNRVGYTQLVLSIVGFIFGFTKEIRDDLDSNNTRLELNTKLDDAEAQRDHARTKRDALHALVRDAERPREPIYNPLRRNLEPN